MKAIKAGVIALSLFAFAACNNKSEENTEATDTTTAQSVDMQGSTDNATGNTDMNNTGSTDAGTPGSSATVTSGNTGNSIPTNTPGGNYDKNIPRKDTSGFAKSGQYNSDVATPKPKNLDDRSFKRNPPAHTYGDTAPKARP